MNITKSEMQRVARQEISEWKDLPLGLVMIIIFAYVHRLTTGETVEQTFFKPKPTVEDYSI